MYIIPNSSILSKKKDKPIIENNIVEKKPKQLLKYSVNPLKNNYQINKRITIKHEKISQ